MLVEPLSDLPVTVFEQLSTLARAEGYEFIDRLAKEYADGSNRFDQPGEALFGIYGDKHLIAIGGLNRDPYLPDANVARVRHLYVLPESRRLGAGRRLIEAIIAAARPNFDWLTLRTFNPEAALFYQALGFQATPRFDNATHHMKLG